jgi:hypothetical protein
MSWTATLEAPHDIETWTEKAWQSFVVDVALRCGWVPVHFRNMRGNDDGYPDLTIIKGDRVVIAELKSTRGTVSARQQLWIAKLAAVGTTVHVWYPRHWRDMVDVLSEGRITCRG